jgi:hypothetical protein
VHIAALEALAAIGIFATIIWLGRNAMAIADAASDTHLRWKARRAWERLAREARARHRSGKCIDDRRPLLNADVVDAEFEEVKR